MAEGKAGSAIILAVIVTGVVSYLFAERQLRKNADALLNDTLQQTSFILNDRLTTIFEQLLFIENNQAYQNIILSANGLSDKGRYYQDIIGINDCFNEVYRRYPQMIHSIYFALSNGREFTLMNEPIPMEIKLNSACQGLNCKRFHHLAGFHGNYSLGPDGFELKLKPYEIKTVRLEMK